MARPKQEQPKREWLIELSGWEGLDLDAAKPVAWESQTTVESAKNRDVLEVFPMGKPRWARDVAKMTLLQDAIIEYGNRHDLKLQTFNVMRQDGAKKLGNLVVHVLSRNDESVLDEVLSRNDSDLARASYIRPPLPPEPQSEQSALVEQTGYNTSAALLGTAIFFDTFGDN